MVASIEAASRLLVVFILSIEVVVSTSSIAESLNFQENLLPVTVQAGGSSLRGAKNEALKGPSRLKSTQESAKANHNLQEPDESGENDFSKLVTSTKLNDTKDRSNNSQNGIGCGEGSEKTPHEGSWEPLASCNVILDKNPSKNPAAPTFVAKLFVPITTENLRRYHGNHLESPRSNCEVNIVSKAVAGHSPESWLLLTASHHGNGGISFDVDGIPHYAHIFATDFPGDEKFLVICSHDARKQEHMVRSTTISGFGAVLDGFWRISPSDMASFLVHEQFYLRGKANAEKNIVEKLRPENNFLRELIKLHIDSHKVDSGISTIPKEYKEDFYLYEPTFYLGAASNRRLTMRDSKETDMYIWPRDCYVKYSTYTAYKGVSFEDNVQYLPLIISGCPVSTKIDFKMHYPAGSSDLTLCDGVCDPSPGNILFSFGAFKEWETFGSNRTYYPIGVHCIMALYEHYPGSESCLGKEPKVADLVPHTLSAGNFVEQRVLNENIGADSRLLGSRTTKNNANFAISDAKMLQDRDRHPKKTTAYAKEYVVSSVEALQPGWEISKKYDDAESMLFAKTAGIYDTHEIHKPGSILRFTEDRELVESSYPMVLPLFQGQDENGVPAHPVRKGYSHQVSYDQWALQLKNSPEAAQRAISFGGDSGLLGIFSSGEKKRYTFGAADTLVSVSTDKPNIGAGLEVATGNYRVMVENGKANKESTVLIDADGVSSTTSINLYDRDYAQKLKVQDLEVGVRHDFDERLRSQPRYNINDPTSEIDVEYHGMEMNFDSDFLDTQYGVNLGWNGKTIQGERDLDEREANFTGTWGKNWKLSLIDNGPDIYSPSSYREVGFGKPGNLYASAGKGRNDQGAAVGSLRLEGPNVGAVIQRAGEGAHPANAYSISLGKFSYTWEAPVLPKFFSPNLIKYIPKIIPG